MVYNSSYSFIYRILSISKLKGLGYAHIYLLISLEVIRQCSTVRKPVSAANSTYWRHVSSLKAHPVRVAVAGSE